MKKHSLVLRLFSMWLALLVLTSSVGVTVQQHTCYVSGKTQRAVVLTPHHGCGGPQATQAAGCKLKLPPKAPNASAKDDCCDFSAHHHKVDAAPDLHLTKVAVPALVALLPEPMWPGLPVAARLAAAPQLVLHATDASPPPRAGRALLAFVCVLVV